VLELARWSTRAGRDGAVRPMVELPLRIAGYDIDFAGHVNNAVYVRWLEDLRTVWMTRWLPLEECPTRGIMPVLARIEIDYRAPLRLADRAVGRVWVTSAGRASAVMESEIARAADGRLCAHALQTVAFVDLTSGRPTRVPPEFREAMS
jgi:acyl-CoA thioester hydrolase